MLINSAKIRFFLLHLLLSGAVALANIYLVFFLWYFYPLNIATGVTSIFLLILLVDVILGPFLTLIIYKKGKKTLFFDISVIVLLQISGLAYGLWTVAKGRPAWLVFAIDRFELVQVVDIDEKNINKASKKYRTPSIFGPQWVAAVVPDNIEERNDLIFETVAGMPDIQYRPNYYKSLETQKSVIQEKLLSLNMLEDFNEKNKVYDVLKKYPDADSWLPLMARVRPMVVLMKKETADIIKIVNLRPWDVSFIENQTQKK